MRCPSCGTDNAPDSRFCGGCGARFAASAQRVAPTQKISDDASFPSPQLARPGGTVVPITAPGIVPPRREIDSVGIPASPFFGQSAPPAQRPVSAAAPAPVGPVTGAGARPAPRPASQARDDYPPGPSPASAPIFAPAAATPASPSVVVPAVAPQAASAAPAAAPAATPQRQARPQSAPAGAPARSRPIAPRRPRGVIAVVLVLDLGLAVAGSWMLRQGLADRPGHATAPAESSSSRHP